MKKNRTVALLPMKANSERVRGKNFREFSGKPLFKWVLDSLLSVGDIDCVVINTDARALLAAHGLVESEKIVIRERHPDICGDSVSMNLIIEDDLNFVDADQYVMTHTTNPFLTGSTISSCLSVYKEGVRSEAVDSLFTVNKVQSRFYLGNGQPVNHDPKNLLRTQDLEPWYSENSNLYIFSKQSFSTTRARIGSKPLLFELSRMESIDIDDQHDWDFAEFVANYLYTDRK